MTAQVLEKMSTKPIFRTHHKKNVATYVRSGTRNHHGVGGLTSKMPDAVMKSKRRKVHHHRSQFLE